MVRSHQRRLSLNPLKKRGFDKTVDTMRLPGIHFRLMPINTEGRAIIILILQMGKQRQLAQFT